MADYCKHGHEMTPDNTILSMPKDGIGINKACRECARIYSAENYKKNRDKRLAWQREYDKRRRGKS